jgi:LPXTG-motif cell wall-anchored protein
MPPTTAPPKTAPATTAPPELPVTGTSTATGALIAGLLMLLAGIGIVLGLRRRRNNRIA